MEKEVVELKKKIEHLEDELMASIRREEILTNGGGDSLKQKLKRTKLGQAAKNPNTFTGKVLRSPRTVYRIVTHPKVLKDIFAKSNGAVSSEVGEKQAGQKREKTVEDLFAPVEFIGVSGGPKRLNLMVKNLEEGLLKEAIEFANKNSYELRVVTSSEGAASKTYGDLVKNKKVPKAENISFYSSVDQSKKNKVYKMEIGEEDIFLTLPWMKK